MIRRPRSHIRCRTDDVCTRQKRTVKSERPNILFSLLLELYPGSKSRAVETIPWRHLAGRNQSDSNAEMINMGIMMSKDIGSFTAFLFESSLVVCSIKIKEKVVNSSHLDVLCGGNSKDQNVKTASISDPRAPKSVLTHACNSQNNISLIHVLSPCFHCISLSLTSSWRHARNGRCQVTHKTINE